ncbi:hypothetical protein ABDK00_012980 [Niabella insulamsoli]
MKKILIKISFLKQTAAENAEAKAETDLNRRKQKNSRLQKAATL